MNQRISQVHTVRRPWLAGALFLLLALPTCSLFNREGPHVTCADLGGKGNACTDGIIASCADGVTLSAVVCDDATVCDASWQTPGAYRCKQSDPVVCLKVECAGSCVDTARDAQNCGGCGVVCRTGGSCVASECVCTGSAATVCGAACVDTATDAANCGACGNTCKADETCSAGTCGACAPGTKQCNGTTPQTCSASRQWQSGAACPYLCNAGTCTGSCVPSAKQCSGSTPQTCDASGQWQSGAACPYLCNAGACGGSCVPTSKQCNVNTPQTCDATGQWQSAAACPFVCTGTGNCTGACVPSTKQCNGTPQTCDASGQWQSVGPADLSAGQGASSGSNPSAVIDAVNAKLLVVTDNTANSGKPALFRCNLDGTGCAYTDISAGQGADTGLWPSAVIDTANGKLLVATSYGAISQTLALFRCNLDGTGCAYTDISAGASKGSLPSAVVDVANAKLFVVAEGNSIRPVLSRCNLDGSACTSTNIATAAGQPDFSGYEPVALIDAANAKLLVVTENMANSGKPSLFRCNLDGSACTYTDISAGQGVNSGFHPSAVIDAVNAKLLVVTENYANSNKPALFRCNLDGTACTYTDISAGQPGLSGRYPSAVIDAANGKLRVVTSNGANSGKPALFRCNLDGTACTYTDISAGQGANSGGAPSAVIDAINGKLRVVTSNGANSDKPALFTACLP